MEIEVKLTAHRARRMIRDYLDRNGIQAGKVSARTVTFDGRDDRVVVSVKDWPTDRTAETIKAFAKERGFLVMVTTTQGLEF